MAWLLLMPAASNPLKSNRQPGRSGAGDESIGEAIIAYLMENPGAQDTARGIAEWWLPEKGLHRGVRDTERALGRLVMEGWVSAWSAADGQRHYRLHPDRQNAIRERSNPEPGEGGKSARGGGRRLPASSPATRSRGVGAPMRGA